MKKCVIVNIVCSIIAISAFWVNNSSFVQEKRFSKLYDTREIYTYTEDYKCTSVTEYTYEDKDDKKQVTKAELVSLSSDTDVNTYKFEVESADYKKDDKIGFEKIRIKYQEDTNEYHTEEYVNKNKVSSEEFHEEAETKFKEFLNEQVRKDKIRWNIKITAFVILIFLIGMLLNPFHWIDYIDYWSDSDL